MSPQETPTHTARLQSESPAWLALLAGRLTTRRVGNTILYVESLDSTSNRAREWLDEGGTDGLLVVAGEQTAGRGRRGRTWSSPPGVGLYFSLGLRPNLAAGHATWLTFLAAVGTAEGLAEIGVKAEIHWPNDLEIAGRKLGGILVETRLEGDVITSAIVGIGINLQQEAGEFPTSLSRPATSVRVALGAPPDPGAVLAAILGRLEHWIQELMSASDKTRFGARLLARWQQLAPGHRGTAVEVDTDEGPFCGITDGLEDDGALRIRGAAGQSMTLRMGDVRRLRETREEAN